MLHLLFSYLWMIAWHCLCSISSKEEKERSMSQLVYLNLLQALQFKAKYVFKIIYSCKGEQESASALILFLQFQGFEFKLFILPPCLDQWSWIWKSLREIINFVPRVDEVHGPTLDLAFCTNINDLSLIFHYLKIVCHPNAWQWIWVKGLTL